MTNWRKLRDAVDAVESSRESLELAIAKLTSSGAPPASRAMLWETAKLAALAHEALASHLRVVKLAAAREALSRGAERGRQLSS